MSNNEGHEETMAVTLHDAMVACLWVALALYATVLISFAIFLASGPELVSLVASMWGISTAAMAIIWVSALGLLKLVALSFVAAALGLWVWKRRIERRRARRLAPPC